MKSLIAAFATFSRIPLPMVEFDSEDFKYSMCYFPLVGAVIGALEILCFFGLSYVDAQPILRAALMTIIPVLVTGGIHMDGFCDTSDAFNSYQDKEKKLEILKDPHIGAFGVIRMIVYFIMYFGLMASIKNVWLLALTFVISRAITAYTVVTYQSAKNKGMGASEQSMSARSAVKKTSIIWLIIALGLSVAAGLFAGNEGSSFTYPIDFKSSGVRAGLCVGPTMLVAALCWCVRYRKTIYKQLGGFTGDTSGWHLTVSELLMAVVIVLWSFM